MKTKYLILFFASMLFVLSFQTISMAQYSAMEAAILNIPENLEFNNGTYKMHYYTDTTQKIISWVASDSCKIEISETDSIIVDIETLCSNHPAKMVEEDNAFIVFYSRKLHKTLQQPILYNKNLNYFSAIDTWTGEDTYMVTVIIKDKNEAVLRYVNIDDASINDIELSRTMSRRITHKINKIAKLPVASYVCEDFIIPPIIIEFKYKGMYNALPIVTKEAPKPYIMSYKLMNKLHGIAIRKLK